MRTLLKTLPFVLLLALLAAAIAFGGPDDPPPMSSINDPFARVDYRTLPPLQQLPARDGTGLAYRIYAPAGAARGSVLLLHGSSADSRSMHGLARALADAGLAAVALDVRGHGATGTKGVIDHVGQLDEDLEDVVRALRLPRPLTLAGFSAGGGFALRFAAGEHQALFDRYLLLAPFIGQDAPTYRPDSGGWVRVGVPRIVAIGLLNSLGVHAFDALPVARFALNEQARAMLTPQYSYALAMNYRPPPDWRATIRAAGQPMQLLAGADDEVFHAGRFAALFAAEGKAVPVTLLPGIGHITLALEPRALQAIVAAALGIGTPHEDTEP